MKKFYSINSYEKYLSIIFPIIQEYEGIRQSIAKKFLIIRIAMYIFCCLSSMAVLHIFYLCAVLCIYGKISDLDTRLLLSFGLIVYPISISLSAHLFAFVKKEDKKFKIKIKSECIPRVLKCFDNIRWGRALSKPVHIAESNLFPDDSAPIFDDCFLGEYKGVKFEIYETALIGFQGVIISMELNKTVKGNTIVASKRDMNIMKNPSIHIIAGFICFLAGAIPIFQVFSINIALCLFIFIIIAFFIYLTIKKYILFNTKKNIKLEDINFEKKFKVYSTDQIEARYLVTPSFMERLYNLKTAFGAKNIKCSFYSDKLILAIPTQKDLFEFGELYQPLTKSKDIKRFYDEIIAIYRIINYFKLYQKTGL